MEAVDHVPITLTGRLARWLLLVSEFDLQYVTRKSVKRRIVAKFLANHLIDEEEDEEYKLSNKDILQLGEDTWNLYFNGVAYQYGYGLGVLLIAPDDSHVPLAFKFWFRVSNNCSEYGACIARLEATLELGAIRLDMIGHSNLVVSQANGDWNVKEEKIKVYHQTLDILFLRFELLTFTHLVRENNRFTDALATLASMLDIPIRVRMRLIIIEQRYTLAYEMIVVIEEAQDEGPWFFDIWNFLEKEVYSQAANAKDKREIRRLVTQFIICGDKLYKRGHLGMHKLCVEEDEAKRIMKAVHRGECGAHMNGLMLARKILR
ncbi:uncharacterized protein LOC114319001 [Camellia sinensis]|uniref:uncharacterized protein LOC114319001 n=1 Tax=Camellia sinensis TaxID=4442 RepID=UPI001035A010|nr:uncharacterized protein LOC114319001 [Camellia sinensis]